MNNALSRGYFKVVATRNDQLRVIQKGANHEILNISEPLPEWDEIKTNILSCMRIGGGKSAVVVDATLHNIQRKKAYYRLSVEGGLKVISVQDAEDTDTDLEEEYVERERESLKNTSLQQLSFL